MVAVVKVHQLKGFNLKINSYFATLNANILEISTWRQILQGAQKRVFLLFIEYSS